MVLPTTSNCESAVLITAATIPASRMPASQPGRVAVIRLGASASTFARSGNIMMPPNAMIGTPTSASTWKMDITSMP